MAVWTIFSITGVKIKQEPGLIEIQFGLLVAMPVLTFVIVRKMIKVDWLDRPASKKEACGFAGGNGCSTGSSGKKLFGSRKIVVPTGGVR